MALRTVTVDHLVGFSVATVKTNTNELKFKSKSKSKSNFNFNSIINNKKFNKLRAYSTTPKTSSSNYIYIYIYIYMYWSTYRTKLYESIYHDAEVVIWEQLNIVLSNFSCLLWFTFISPLLCNFNTVLFTFKLKIFNSWVVYFLSFIWLEISISTRNPKLLLSFLCVGQVSCIYLNARRTKIRK